MGRGMGKWGNGGKKLSERVEGEELYRC